MSLTRQLVEGLQPLRFADLAEADLAAARALLLDHLGVVARGAQTESAAAAQAFLGNLGAEATLRLPIIGTQRFAPPVVGALVNAVAGHSIEYDDLHNASSTHPGVVVFPAALATALLTDADGPSVLTAAVVGYEVMGRVGAAANPAEQYRLHFHPTATCGHVGAAATAAHLLGLSVQQTVSALGIAATMAGGSMQFLEDGSWLKRLNPGFATRNGIQAALLAHAGYDGGRDGLAGAHGFLATHSDAADPERLVMGLDAGPRVARETSIKAHTCCRYKQGPIDALLALRRRYGLLPDHIERVTLGLLEAGVGIIAEPIATKRRPKNVVDAQFSMPYGAAVALADGRAGLDQYVEARLSDPALLELMDRVEYAVDPALDREYPAHWPAWARVELRDGRSVGAQVAEPKGDPGNPLDATERRAKFDALTTAIWSRARREAIGAAVENLVHPGSLKPLLELLPNDQA